MIAGASAPPDIEPRCLQRGFFFFRAETQR